MKSIIFATAISAAMSLWRWVYQSVIVMRAARISTLGTNYLVY